MGEQTKVYINPMDALHFDLTTKYMRGRRGRKIADLVVQAARLVLVYQVEPADVRQLDKYANISPKAIWSAVRRYPRMFKQAQKEGNKVAITILVDPEYEDAFAALDAAQAAKLAFSLLGNGDIDIWSEDPSVLEAALQLKRKRDKQESVADEEEGN